MARVPDFEGEPGSERLSRSDALDGRPVAEDIRVGDDHEPRSAFGGRRPGVPYFRRTLSRRRSRE